VGTTVFGGTLRKREKEEVKPVIEGWQGEKPEHPRNQKAFFEETALREGDKDKP